MAPCIPVILGTARKGRQSEKAAKFMVDEAVKAGIRTELLDVRDYRIDATDNTKRIPKAKKLKPKIEKADGLIIVAPEYNHGYPGELKMMLDMVYEEYRGKPVGICGVSAGGLGGARMVEALRQVAVELRMIPIREAVYFSKVQDLFDSRGKIKDGSYREISGKFLKELMGYANAMKSCGKKLK